MTTASRHVGLVFGDGSTLLWDVAEAPARPFVALADALIQKGPFSGAFVDGSSSHSLQHNPAMAEWE